LNLLKGFGKDYFSFSALTMYSTAKKILTFKDATSTEKALEDSELTNNLRPCHCDCVFRLKTKLATLMFKYIPRCPFYTTYFAFRRTGVHPPLLSL